MGICFVPMIKALFANDDILIIDKPAGLPVQPGEAVGISVLDAVERDYGFRPFLVHRLDKDTSGCLLLARTSRSASFYSSVLSSVSTRKVYRAIILGRPKPEEGVFDSDVRFRGKALSAKTYYKSLKTWDDLSLVEAELGSGRTHQIRQHFARAGWPIAGDDKYGNFGQNRLLAKNLNIKRLMLYAFSLSIVKPEKIYAEAGLPPHFEDFFKRSSGNTV